MRNSVKMSIGAALAVAAMPVPAQAVLLTFELTGSRSATFQLDSNPTPTTFSSSAFGNQISFANVSGTFNGAPGTATIGFGSGDIFAALNITGTSLGFTQFAGPDIFTGTAAAPIFAPGTFALTSIVSGNSTLRVSQAAAAVPEPATWAMLIVGFGIVGYAMRRRSVRFAPMAV